MNISFITVISFIKSTTFLNTGTPGALWLAFDWGRLGTFVSQASRAAPQRNVPHTNARHAICVNQATKGKKNKYARKQTEIDVRLGTLATT